VVGKQAVQGEGDELHGGGDVDRGEDDRQPSSR
jgi:hypothetical protein